MKTTKTQLKYKLDILPFSPFVSGSKLSRQMAFTLNMAQSTCLSSILSLSTQDVDSSNMAKGDRPIRKICKASIVQMICGILIFFTAVPSLALVIVVVIQGLKTKRSRRAYAKKGVRVRKIKMD
jgi:hypothetical protein